jgi:phosphatidylinositol alpha-mannosyltransferase
MRILLSHPYCWPYVRRGSERYIDELARYLIQRGHEVVTLSSKRGRGRVEETPAGRRILLPQLWLPPMAKLRIQPTHTFAATSFVSFARLEADAVHSLYFTDAFSASLARPVGRYRTVFQLTGAPLPWHFPRLPPDRWMLEQAIQRADRVMVHSRFTWELVRRHYGVDRAVVIPVPINLDSFPLHDRSRRDALTILSVASFDEPRKGLRVLLEAFAEVHRKVPEARLKLCGQLSERTRAAFIEPLPDEVRAKIEVLGVGRLDELPRIYGGADVTVLPSMWEAYGMAVVESWACGTPVVVADHGGLRELVDADTLGFRFDPSTDGHEAQNPDGLAEAILRCWELSRDPQTPARCRARAERFSWSRLGPEVEALYAA